MPSTHARTCHICEANCGILVEVEGREVLSIRGNPEHVLSRGHICPKATAIADLQADPDRLRRPARRDGDRWTEVSWDEAFADLGRRFGALGPGETGLYLGNPVAHNYGISTQVRPLRKALGVKGIFSASTLDQIPHQLVQMWMYGHNALFPIPDVDRAHTFLVVGANPLASNGSVWTVPGVKRRLRDLQARGGRLIVVDPRRTETARLADEHLFVRPGTDAAFFTGLLLALRELDAVRPGRLEPMLDAGWAQAWAALDPFELEACAAFCGVEPERLRGLAKTLADAPRSVVYGRLGVSTQAFGTLNLWLIQLLNIALGSLDAEGGAMFSTPAVDLVATMGRGSRGRFTSRTGDHPEVLSEWPTAILADEILEPGEGRLRGLVTVAGNPVLSAPNGRRLDEALGTLEVMVSIDPYITETSRHASYVLPPCGPLERDHFGLTLGPIAIRNFACYSKPTLAREPGTLDDWEIVAGLARAVSEATGREIGPSLTPREVLDGGLRASGHGLGLAELEAAPNGIDLGTLEPRLPERLATDDRKIHCAPRLCLEELERFREEMARPAGSGLALIGRRHLRSNNSWLHNAHRLVKGSERCTLMIHPDDAGPRGIEDGAEVRVESRVGAIALPAEVTSDIARGTVSIPHGWGHGREGVRLRVARAHAGVSINDLTDPARLDRPTGNAAFSGTPVEVSAAPRR